MPQQRAKGRDAGAHPDQQQVRRCILRQFPRLAEWAIDRELIAGPEVTQVIGGYAGPGLAAVLVDITAALDADFDTRPVRAHVLRSVRDGIEPEMVRVSRRHVRRRLSIEG